jgi:rod shape-determining protein MreB and related proteins
MALEMLRSFTSLLYVRVSPERLVVTDVKSGESVSEVPEIAVGGEPKRVLGSGAAARLAAAHVGGTVINPFAHPRSLVSDFTSAEQLIKSFVHRVNGKSWWVPSPRIVIHPLGDPDGGFTQVERRAFREMALGAGASEVVVWTGRELTNQEVSDGTFPVGGFAE